MELTYLPHDNSYHVNRKTPFQNQPVSQEILEKSFDFAFDMIYGLGHHRSYRTGGTTIRKKGEKFCNAFQGKLAEMLLNQTFSKAGIRSDGVDVGVYGKGVWDDGDIIINGYKINVKSCAHFSNLFLLEQLDWDVSGNYLPNIQSNEQSVYDYFVMVRIKPDLKSVFRQHRVLYSDDAKSKEFLAKIVFSERWGFDIPGYFTRRDLLEVIAKKNILPKGALLNGRIPMDASNYYVQSGDLKPLREIMDFLKKGAAVK